MGIKLRHDVAGIMQTKDNSRFNAGMQMVQRQQERDNAMRLSQMQPLKYNTGGTYGGIGIGDQRKKAKPGMGAEPVFGVDPVLPQQPSMPSWQEDNEEIQKMIDAGGFGYGVSRQLRNLIDRENTLRNSTRLNDAQKQEGLDRILRNKAALVGTSSLDPNVANTIRDQQQGPNMFNQWVRENPDKFLSEYNNARTRLMERNPQAVPTRDAIMEEVRAPFDAFQPKAEAKPPAAAADDDNPYESFFDEVKQEEVVKRQYGGPVYPGQTSVVGEEGPELMRVGYDGVAQVTPNPATMARMQEDQFPDAFGSQAILAQMAAPAATQSPANMQPQTQQRMQQFNTFPLYDGGPDLNEIKRGATSQLVYDRLEDEHNKRYDKWRRNEANRLYAQRPVAADTPSIGKPRVWTNNKGKTFKGELRGVRHFNDGDPAVSDVAVIRGTDGETYVIPLQDLSPDDQRIVMQTPDYASETRMNGENQGTQQERFNPETPEGKRMREPRPRKTPTPEQLESGREGKYGVGGVTGGMLSQRGGARQEASPAYKQPVLSDGQIATVPGLANPPGVRVTGPKGERLPPAGASMDPRDVSPYTQVLAELGPTEGAKWTAALKKKGRWLFRDADSEAYLAQAGKLKKRGVDGYGKPYASPSDEPQFQPPARPAWWDSWKDPNAQERRLTPQELAARGYMVNQAGQVVPIPRDSQGRPVMQPPSAPQQQAPQSTPQTASGEKTFDPTSAMASQAINVLLRPRSREEEQAALAKLSQLGAPEDFIASLSDGPTAQQDKYVARDKEGRPYAINDPIWGPIASFAADPLGPYNPLGPKKPSASQNTTQSQQPAQQPAQQGFPTIDAMTSQIAPQQSQTSSSRKDLIAQQQPQQKQSQQKKPIGLPKTQPAVQDQFWNNWWATQPAAYQSPKDQKPSMVELTAADGNRKLKGTVELISNPIEEIGGQRVITFKRDDGAVVTFYSGQLSEDDQDRLMAMAEISNKGYSVNSDSKEKKPKMKPEEPKPQDRDGINRGRQGSRYPRQSKTS